MKINKYLSIVLLFMAGCSTAQPVTVQSVLNSYKTVVFDDTISLEEAKIIAQRQLVAKNVVELYYLSNPQLEGDVSALPHNQDYWFIFFEEKQPSSIPFIFMVVINRQTGAVKFADDFNVGSQWILEAALLQ
jgi:hypothetical protein